jgi:nucleoside recognition membrane protein YjiH
MFIVARKNSSKQPMNRLFWNSGIAVFVATAFLLTTSPISSNAYHCNKSIGANHTNSSSGVNGTSGNVTKSALTSWDQIFNFALQGLPPPCAHIEIGMSGSGTF